jgi:hypothetical protein
MNIYLSLYTTCFKPNPSGWSCMSKSCKQWYTRDWCNGFGDCDVDTEVHMWKMLALHVNLSLRFLLHLFFEHDILSQL